MFRFFSLIILVTCLFNASLSQAQEKKVANQPLPADDKAKAYPLPAAAAKVADTTYLVSNADEFAVIYERLITKQYPRALGHATAAARLVNCLLNNKADEKADFLDQIIQNLDYGTADNVRRRVIARVKTAGKITDSPQAAQLASVLACKMGERKVEAMMDDFDAAVLELMAKMKKANNRKNSYPTLFQLITVAELMN